MQARLLMVASTLLSAACASTADLGSVPDDLVELYDAARPAGVIELEIDRDGAIREMEAEVPVDALPQAIVDAARTRHPRARIMGAERELTREGSGWEVKLDDAGRAIELVFDEGGELLEFERELQRSEAPQGLIEAAQTAIGGGSFRSVEVVEQGERRLYHVKLEREGVSYKVILTPEASVVRKVREHRAEIEIPLR